MSDKHKDHSHSETEPHSHAGFLGANTELLFALASGFMLAAGFIIGKVSASTPAWLPFICYLSAYFFGGFFTLREAIENLLQEDENFILASQEILKKIGNRN